MANKYTDAELLAQAQALDAAYARSSDCGEHLDAYGHMNWTVGNEDWLACFDAIRRGDKIFYHVIVDCESGGFTDTPEHGEIAVTDANAVDNLKCFPSYWADICSEIYVGIRDYGPVKWQDCADSWSAHIDNLVAAPALGEDSESADEKAAWYAELNRGYARDRL
jgi:hypothetical protein